MPLLGNPTAAVLYPGKLVFCRPIPYPWGARLYVIGHVLLAAAGMYALSRSWGVSRAGSGIAALGYGFGAPVLFQYCNVIFLVGAALDPARPARGRSLAAARAPLGAGGAGRRAGDAGARRRPAGGLPHGALRGGVFLGALRDGRRGRRGSWRSRRSASRGRRRWPGGWGRRRRPSRRPCSRPGGWPAWRSSSGRGSRGRRRLDGCSGWGRRGGWRSARGGAAGAGRGVRRAQHAGGRGGAARHLPVQRRAVSRPGAGLADVLRPLDAGGEPFLDLRAAADGPSPGLGAIDVPGRAVAGAGPGRLRGFARGRRGGGG